VHAGGTGARVRVVRCRTPVVVKGWEAAVTVEPVPSIAAQEPRAKREFAQLVAAALARVPNRATPVAVHQRVIRGLAGPGLVTPVSGAEMLVVGH
jgi:hypothetical protein